VAGGDGFDFPGVPIRSALGPITIAVGPERDAALRLRAWRHKDQPNEKGNSRESDGGEDGFGFIVFSVFEGLLFTRAGFGADTLFRQIPPLSSHSDVISL
jgi:hypothetical protein